MIAIDYPRDIDYPEYDYLPEEISLEEVDLFDKLYKRLEESHLKNLNRSQENQELWYWSKVNDEELKEIFEESDEINSSLEEYNDDPKKFVNIVSEWIDKYNEYDIENGIGNKYSLHVDDGEIKLMERKNISKKTKSLKSKVKSNIKKTFSKAALI